jgi:hypothetical protein
MPHRGGPSAEKLPQVHYLLFGDAWGVISKAGQGTEVFPLGARHSRLRQHGHHGLVPKYRFQVNSPDAATGVEVARSAHFRANFCRPSIHLCLLPGVNRSRSKGRAGTSKVC